MLQGSSLSSCFLADPSLHPASSHISKMFPIPGLCQAALFALFQLVCLSTRWNYTHLLRLSSSDTSTKAVILNLGSMNCLKLYAKLCYLWIFMKRDWFSIKFSKEPVIPSKPSLTRVWEVSLSVSCICGVGRHPGRDNEPECVHLPRT